MVEIATIGDEGLIGINAFFGSDMMAGEAMMQVPRHQRRSHVR